jgi:hypothetical protein
MVKARGRLGGGAPAADGDEDLKTRALILAAHTTWMLGYPEQAVRIIDASHAHARRLTRLARLGAAAAGEILAAPHCNELRKADARARRGRGGA